MTKIFIILFIVGFLLLFQSPVNAQSAYPIYIVQPGDSLGGIAQLFDVDLNDLIGLNGISDPDSLSPGQSLKIPGMGQEPGFLSLRPIQLFEQIDDVIIQEQISRDWLIAYNNLVSPTQIYTGTELLVLTPENMSKKEIVFSPDDQTTFLENCVISNENPIKLEVINQKSSGYLLLPLSNIYTKSSPESVTFSSAPIVSITPLPLEQGATEIISVTSDQIKKVSGRLNGYDLQFFVDETGNFAAIQGVHAMANPGLSEFSLSFEFLDGTFQQISDSLLLKAGDFDFEEITVDDINLIDPNVTGPENEFINGLISIYTPTQYWDGIFQSPAVYQYYNSLFGTRRTYNGSGIITFHTGVDFGGGITLPIFAPAAGRVVFAGPLTVRGNTVFIDHGLGIYSGFFHQNSLLVKTGDFVTQGQQIGEVGNTGRVDGSDNYYGAGAHLHWEVWANGVQVNPLSWLIYQYP